jgi:hypothetical protein
LTEIFDHDLQGLTVQVLAQVVGGVGQRQHIVSIIQVLLPQVESPHVFGVIAALASSWRLELLAAGGHAQRLPSARQRGVKRPHVLLGVHDPGFGSGRRHIYDLGGGDEGRQHMGLIQRPHLHWKKG